MIKVLVFFALLVALISGSAAEIRIKRQTYTASVSPNGFQANLGPYNQYNPYNSYNPYNPYNPYQTYNPYTQPFQNPLYPGLPGQSTFPGLRTQPGLTAQ